MESNRQEFVQQPALLIAQPIYVLSPLKKRILIPKLVALIVLSGIFYLGVILNLALLNLEQQILHLVQLIALTLIVILFGLGIILATIKSKKKYYFYSDYLKHEKRQLFYREITTTKVKQTPWDNLFKTYSLIINSKFKVKGIPIAINLSSYIQKLINYSSRRL